VHFEIFQVYDKYAEWCMSNCERFSPGVPNLWYACH